MTRLTWSLLLVALGAGAARADEADTAHVGSLSLTVYPAEIRLEGARDASRLVVQASRPDGTTLDLSGTVGLRLADPSLARVEGATLIPLADGVTRVRVEYQGRVLEAPLTVSDAETRPPLSFRNDCLPALTRAGCNTGSCHGASRGKDGFRLSLFGYDPDGDYFRVTRELAGRRINLAAPRESLLLQKATESVRHTGGERFPVDGGLYRTILEWLEAGAQADPADLPRLTGLDLWPPRSVLATGGAGQSLLAQASYADGRDRDVTGLAAFNSSDSSVAQVTSQGVIVPGRRGEAWVTARFGEFTVGAQVLVVPEEAYVFPADEPEEHPLDRLVNAKLRALKVTPAPLADDATFLRRVTLDVTGQLPTPTEVEAFLGSDDPNKRVAKVDELLARKEFVELWVMQWAEKLLIRSSQRVSEKAALRYAKWLDEQISGNVPVDAMVRDLLTAKGGVFDTPQANFYQAEEDAKKVAENVAQVFLGIRLQCAQCHNHPFDRWTQDDYYGWAAFFAQIGRKKGGDPRETIVFDRRRGEVKHPVDDTPRAPRFLGGEAPDTKNKDRRAVVADWLTAPENPWFARNLANMVWTHFFGVGIVHEPDDMRVSNPPSNPALLDALAKQLVDSGYDFRQLVRSITTSRAYQRATTTHPSNALDTRNYARAQVRRLRAEVLLDAIAQVTDAPNTFRGLPRGARAVQIADGAYQDYFLTAFGRSSRETVCSCEVTVQPNLSQALHLLNGATVNGKIRQGKLIPALLKQGLTVPQVIDQLYLRCFGRPPTASERQALVPRMKGEGRRQQLEDLFWALLNAREFLFNH
jgi:hypothetical protein